MTWEVEPTESFTTKPGPLFPKVPQALPKALSGPELDRVNHYRHLRSLIRDGPLYTILDRSQLTDDHGKTNRRSGFDPFDGMPSFSKRYHKPNRSLPDLSTRSYFLKYFPKELWSTLDPKRQNPAWNTLGPLLPDPPGMNTSAKGKRKAHILPTQNPPSKRRHVGTPSDDEEEDDVAIAPGRRKRAQKREKDVSKDNGQRKGLEAEDDYGPDNEQANDDDQDGEEVQEDSAFEESDDGAGDDYNAENYFDGGDDDDFDDGGGDDEGGTFLG